MGYLGATLTQVFTRGGWDGAYISLKDVTIPWDGKRGQQVRMTSRTGSARRILGIWRKLVKTCLGRRRLAFACSPKPGQWPVAFVADGAHDGGGGRWKSQNRKNVYLSPCVEKPLNSKVIKSFVPEQKFVSVFRVSRFLCSILYIYEHYMTISHIAVSGYGTLVNASYCHTDPLGCILCLYTGYVNLCRSTNTNTHMCRNP